MATKNPKMEARMHRDTSKGKELMEEDEDVKDLVNDEEICDN